MGAAEGYLSDLCGRKRFGYQASGSFDDIGYALEVSYTSVGSRFSTDFDSNVCCNCHDFEHQGSKIDCLEKF